MATMQNDYPAALDLVVTRGSTTETLVFTFAGLDGAPYDVSAWTFRLVAVDAQGGVVVDWSSPSGGLLNGGAAGTVAVDRTAAQTWALAATAPGAPLAYSLCGTSSTTRHEVYRGALTIQTPPVPYP